MYNSFQYSIKVWLTSSLTVPHIYVLYFMITSGTDASFPMTGYLELLIICILLSMPVWFLYMLALDAICRTPLSIQAKKTAGLVIFELLLIILFSVVMRLGDGFLNWRAYFDFIFICCFTAAISVYFYKLQPVKRRSPA